MKQTGIKVLGQDRSASHEYFILERYEAGIELVGTEVKSLRAGRMSLKEAWCQVQNGEMILRQMHISPYEQGNIYNKDPLRPRRLLLHKREIRYLDAKVHQDGYSIIPLKVYLKDSLIKVEIALCQGKKLYDKRESAAKKDALRQMDRAMKAHNQRG